jgi:choline dehydrogenase-like flavoprotein
VILDVRDVGTDPPRVDLCIVGGGPAGLTLAAALSHTGMQILLLEGGSHQTNGATQDLYRGEVIGNHPSAHEYRVRALGGSSKTWGGGCVPLDPIDFVERDWVPGGRWPLGYNEMRRYYRRALVAAEAGRCEFGAPSPLIPGVDGASFCTRLERFSRPTDFWKRWRSVLKSSRTVRVVLNATVIEIRLTAGGNRVDHIVGVAPDGREFQVRARAFVLCVGGLETARLLLASRNQVACGVGNQNDWVGRGYMCHTAGIGGAATFTVPPQAIGFGHHRDADGIYCRRRLLLSEVAQRQHRTLNLAFRLRTPDPSDASHGDAVLSALHLGEKFLRNDNKQGESDRPDTLAHLTNLACKPLRLISAAGTFVRERLICRRRAPSFSFRPLYNRYAVEFHGEQAVNPESRVTLGCSRDRFDMPRLRIDWRLSAIDVETVVRGFGLLARRMTEARVGRLDYSEDELPEIVKQAGAYGGHHIGTARMSALPKDGVVDPNGAVHGIGNLYVSGSAIMPTSGQANPTLTILALAYRLAAHLGEHFSHLL